MSRVILGVDGGGTKTHYTLFDEFGTLISFYKGGPGNHETYSDGYRGLYKELSASIKVLTAQANIEISDIYFGVFGMAGADIPIQYAEISKVINKVGIINHKVVNDAFLGIKAGCDSGYGICSVNGTGHCCVGIDAEGSLLQVGGIGFISGDEAGAGYISELVIRKVYDAEYRCGPKTIMTEMLLEALGINKISSLIEAVYSQLHTGIIDKNDLNKIGFIAANQKDKVAIEALQYVGKQLGLSICGVYSKLNFPKQNVLEIVLAGSIYVKGENPTIIDTLTIEVKKRISQDVNIIQLQYLPVTGAVLYGIECVEPKLLNDSLRHKIRKSLKYVND